MFRTQASLSTPPSVWDAARKPRHQPRCQRPTAIPSRRPILPAGNPRLHVGPDHVLGGSGSARLTSRRLTSRHAPARSPRPGGRSHFPPRRPPCLPRSHRRSNTLGHIAGLATKVHVCDATANFLADANHVCTAGRVCATISTPWGRTSIGDHATANHIAGSRHCWIASDNLRSIDRPSVARVSDAVHAAIARVVFAANRGPENIACHVVDNGTACSWTVHDPQMHHAAQLSTPVECPTVWRPDLVTNNFDRLQLDLDSVRVISQRLCPTSTAAEQPSPIPRLSATGSTGLWGWSRLQRGGVVGAANSLGTAIRFWMMAT